MFGFMTVCRAPADLCVCVCVCVCAKLLQWCLTLCNPMHCSLSGSSVNGILQARILKWVAMPSSRGSSQPRDRPVSPALQTNFLPSEPPRKSGCHSLLDDRVTH